MTRHVAVVALRWIEWGLLVAGVACATWLYVTWKEAFAYQLQAKSAYTWKPPTVGTVVHDDGLIGILTIPSINLSVAVVDRDDDMALRIAVGHLPDTPLPWEHGNSGLAGHRDSYFAALGGVRIGDALFVSTRHGTLEYRVTSMTIVEPDDVSVLAAATGAHLTLITCYPFGYLGPAPKRFVVHATRVVP